MTPETIFIIVAGIILAVYFVCEWRHERRQRHRAKRIWKRLEGPNETEQ